MGYVHDAGFAGIPTFPTQVWGDTAAWAIAAGQTSGSLVYACDATDEVANLWIPIHSFSHLPDSAGNAVKGAKITKIEVDYEIVVAACDAVTAYIYKMKRGADDADVVVSEPAFTYDAAHDTDDERDDLQEHRMELNITTPFYLEDDEYLYVKIAFDKAATSTVEFLVAVPYFTLRA